MKKCFVSTHHPFILHGTLMVWRTHVGGCRFALAHPPTHPCTIHYKTLVGGASLLWLHRSTSAPSVGNLIWDKLWLTLAKYLWRPSQCGHKLDDWTVAIFTVGLQKGWCANKDTHPFLWELLKRWVYHTSWKKIVPDLYVSIMGSVLCTE
jgi:hypothetical protein